MGWLKESLFVLTNRVGHVLPKHIQRRIADYHGVLSFFSRLSLSEVICIHTPEGHSLAMNPLFHSNLTSSGSLNNYEPEIRKAISKLARPGMVAYDVGANVGVFSYLFSSVVGDKGTVYSFEPEPNNYRYFKISLERNNVANIVLDTRAIGKSKCVSSFDRRGGAFSGRLIGQSPSYKVTKNILPVETVNIDYLIDVERLPAPDILKIDVEGNEGLVLEGMKNCLKQCNVVIICELHKHLGDSSSYVADILKECGYVIYEIRFEVDKYLFEIENSGKFNGSHIVALKH